MASAQVVETSVTNNSPSQDSYHPDDLFQSRYYHQLFQELKLEMHDLTRKVKALPELLSQEVDKTTKLTDQFGSMKMSNMEGIKRMSWRDYLYFFLCVVCYCCCWVVAQFEQSLNNNNIFI